jgi:hypothetical protein
LQFPMRNFNLKITVEDKPTAFCERKGARPWG